VSGVVGKWRGTIHGGDADGNVEEDHMLERVGAVMERSKGTGSCRGVLANLQWSPMPRVLRSLSDIGENAARCRILSLYISGRLWKYIVG